MSHWATLADLGQSGWYDFIRRDLMTSGKLGHMISDLGLRGMTTNPTIFAKAVEGSSLYDGDVAAARAGGAAAQEIFEVLAVKDVQMAADLFRPVYDMTSGQDGMVSIEVRPELAYDAAGTITEARRLWARCDRPNVMIKIPGTVPGLTAIRTCLAEGINVNVTLLFSVERYEATLDAWLQALEQRAAAGLPLDRVASVASFFVSRVDTLVDSLIDIQLKRVDLDPSEQLTLSGLKSRLAIANARLAYEAFEKVIKSRRFQILAARGAVAQRPLWASTSTKNPALGATYYVDALTAPTSVNTVPPETWEAYLVSGVPALRIHDDLDQAHTQVQALAHFGISFAGVAAQLEFEGVQKFADSYHQLLKAIDSKR